MHQKLVLGMKEAMAALEAMVKAATEKPGRPVAMAIVDDHGDLVCFACMAGANAVLARQIAIKKAVTAACMRADTIDFEERMKAQGGSIAEFSGHQLIGGLGGLVITLPSDGTILGGIGVSGRPPEEDLEVAEAGRRALQF